MAQISDTVMTSSQVGEKIREFAHLISEHSTITMLLAELE